MEKLNIFLSWSGEQSKVVAEGLKEWLPLVLGEYVTPWFSVTDIGAGNRPIIEIGRTLEATGLGILCVTSTNKSAPWMIFEAGALSKSLDSSAVVPYLIDLEIDALTGPLTQFQAKRATPSGTLDILNKINNESGRQVSDVVLENRFHSLWPKLESYIQQALSFHTINHFGDWWVYSLIVTTPDGTRNTVGFFRMQYSQNDYSIDEGRALWAVNEGLVHRGSWTSEKVWVHGKMIRLIYSMRSGKSIEGAPSKYEGYLELNPSSLKPIIGDSSWIGWCNDLGERASIRGPLYAEKLSPLKRVDPDDLKRILKENMYALLERAQDYWIGD